MRIERAALAVVVACLTACGGSSADAFGRDGTGGDASQAAASTGVTTSVSSSVTTGSAGASQASSGGTGSESAGSGGAGSGGTDPGTGGAGSGAAGSGGDGAASTAGSGGTTGTGSATSSGSSGGAETSASSGSGGGFVVEECSGQACAPGEVCGGIDAGPQCVAYDPILGCVGDYEETTCGDGDTCCCATLPVIYACGAATGCDGDVPTCDCLTDFCNAGGYECVDLATPGHVLCQPTG